MSEPIRLSLADPAWREFTGSCPDATPFHHPAWAALLEEAYGYRGFVLALPGADGRPVAGAPVLEVRTLGGRRHWVSLPFTDECPVLAADPGAAERFLAAVPASQERLGAPRIEVRAPVGAVAWHTRADAVIHELPIEADAEVVRRRFSRSQVVRNINRAEREGVQVRVAATLADLDEFYALHTRTRRRQGVPVQPRRFFDLLWERLLEPGLGSILLASHEERTLAGALFLNWNGTTIYKFGASDPEGLSLRPNHALFWSAIRASCERGDRRFDFGRTDLDNPGLRAFKSSWGGVERPLVYSALEPGAAAGSEGAVGRALGVAIRRGPRWLCRGLGETVYRYAAVR